MKNSQRPTSTKTRIKTGVVSGLLGANFGALRDQLPRKQGFCIRVASGASATRVEFRKQLPEKQGF